MRNKKRAYLLGLGWLIIFSAYASIPASMTYVDQQIAILKTEILQILHND